MGVYEERGGGLWVGVQVEMAERMGLEVDERRREGGEGVVLQPELRERGELADGVGEGREQIVSQIELRERVGASRVFWQLVEGLYRVARER